MTHLRYNGYRVRHAGQGEGAEFVSYGWLCRPTCNKDSDPRVAIYFTPGLGYTYTLRGGV